MILAGPGLEDMLRNWLACRINQDRIQWALLTKANLTLEAAHTKARAMETAEKNSKEIQTPQAEAPAAAPTGQEVPVRPLLCVEKQQKAKSMPMTKCYCYNHTKTVNVDSKTTRARVVGEEGTLQRTA